MSEKFFRLGTITTTAGNQAFPLGDGAPTSAGATTLGFPTAASLTADFYKDMMIVITAGSGVGQRRRIRSYSTAQVATVAPWESPRPDTASTFVVGVPVDGRDAIAFKAEHVGTASTGTWRGELWTQEETPKRILTTTFQLAFVGSAGTTSGLSSTAAYHGETKVVDYLGPIYAVAKAYVDIAPTAVIEIYGAATFTSGRRENR